VHTVCSEDISRIDGKRRNEKLTMMILRSYARNISSLAKKTTMLADVGRKYSPSLKKYKSEQFLQ
jgi:hypothetical protein